MRLFISPCICLVLASAAGAQPLDAAGPVGQDAPITRTAFPPRSFDLPARTIGNRGPTTLVDLNAAPEGDIPREAVFTPDGGTLLVIHTGTGLAPGVLTFFDPHTRTPVGAVDVGMFPMHVAVTPSGSHAIVPNVGSNTVSIVDIATRTVAAEVPITGTQPYRAVVTADGRYAVVGVANDETVSAFSVIDLASRTEVRSIPTPKQGFIGFGTNDSLGSGTADYTDFRVTPDGSTVVLPFWAANPADCRAIFYDLNTGAELASLPIDGAPNAIDMSADGTVAVIQHIHGVSKITILDVPARAVTSVYPAPMFLFITPPVIRITPDKSEVIIHGNTQFAFMNLATGAATAPVATGLFGDIEISHDGRYAFLSSLNSRVVDISSKTIVKTIATGQANNATVSPTEYLAVGLNNSFGEELRFCGIDGASGSLIETVPSSHAPEADATVHVAVSPDGRTAVASNRVSDNVTIVDLATRSPRAYVATGIDPQKAAVTPDGRWVLVPNRESNTLSIIDLLSDSVAATLATPDSPFEVRFSPDGGTAYLACGGGIDQLCFVDLDGAASAIVGMVPAGNFSTAFGYAHSETSSFAVSADGSMIATCAGADDMVRLIDVATRSVIVDVPVGDHPMRCAFTPDGSKLYVTSTFTDDVRVIAVNGAASAVVATIPGMDFPLSVDVAPSGQYVYVGNVGADFGIRVIETATDTVVATAPTAVPVRETHLSPDGHLYAAGYIRDVGARLVKISAAGPASAVVETFTLTSSAADLGFSEPLGLAVTTQPVTDALDVVEVRPVPACRADFDGQNGVQVADIFAFLRAWFANSPSADFDQQNGIQVADIFAFLRAWFAGCP